MTSLTFVTPVLNRADTIGEALESVARQWRDGDEHLVVDGGSTDGTEAAVAAFPHATWIDAPGTGIYDALNLGIARATCGHVMLVNSDDWLVDGALDDVRAAIGAAPGEALIRGRALFAAGPDGERWQPHQPPALDIATILEGALCINAFVFARHIFRDLGGFDPRWRVAADREWMLRAWIAGCRPHELARQLYCYRVHESSLTIRPDAAPNAKAIVEHLEILADYLARRPGPELEDRLRRWEAVEIGRLIKARLAGAGTTQALRRSIWQATRRNPLWPVALLQAMRNRARHRHAQG